MFSGAPEKGIEYMERGYRLSPRDTIASGLITGHSTAYRLMGNYDKSLELIEKAVALSPEYTTSVREHINALAVTGRMDEAKSALKKLQSLVPGYSIQTVRDIHPFILDDDLFDKFVEGLRMAGMPES